MEETKGVFLVAFGKRGYAYSAYNLARSIKFYNPDLPITVFHDDAFLKWITGYKLEAFDNLIQIPDEVKYDKTGRYFPAQIKTSVYKYLPYDYNLFLDVDSLAMQDVTPVIDDLIAGGDYYNTILFAEHNYKTQGREIGAMIWAYADEIWERYKLPEDAKMPCIQSSLQFIKKCPESEALFAQVQENLANPIPLENLRRQWGASQPDELYMNIAMCQKGINGKMQKSYVWFTNGTDARSVWQLQKEFPILGLFGNSNMIRKRYTEFYDLEMIRMMRKWGMNHEFKFYYIKADKHANTRQIPVRKVESAPARMQKAKLSISETVKIDSSKLIQSYPDSNGRHLKPTNWFNCSFIEFKGKTYFAYRMECAPFCEKMKIGLCLLDENLQPIKSTNVLPELYSELQINYRRNGQLTVKKYPKGFHVEDPRFFIYKDEIYLSYTDGYIMGQAKINPETLQAEESFYLDKPVHELTEKNWTFFENEGELYSVYDPATQIIFKMNGSKSEKLYETAFENKWAWGTMRGGSSPVRIGENYLTFFHSALEFNHVSGKGRQYFMGAYLFEGQAPFRPIAISKEPLLAGEKIPDNIPRLSNKIFVVFPGGQIRKENSWMVAFGSNDLECRMVEITDEILKENLVEIKYKEEVLA